MNDFFEKTLEDIIIQNKEECIKRGFTSFLKHTENQFLLPNGAIIDILSFEINESVLYAKIFELKRECLTVAALLQCIDYGQEFYKSTANHFKEVKIELYIVGSDADENLLKIATWGVNMTLIFYEYKVDGIKFDYDPPENYPANYNIYTKNLFPYNDTYLAAGKSFIEKIKKTAEP